MKLPMAKTVVRSKLNELGMIGLGVMGRNLLLNIADHGFSVAGYDNDNSKVTALLKESKGKNIFGTNNIRDFTESLHKPRAIMMLVPAGAPVDSVINELTAILEPGDIIIDAGNSYFKDTNIRARKLKELDIYFLGAGISGGEEGARNGPSIMPGGPREAYDWISRIFKAAAAQVKDEPCVTYLGPGSAGHFVKMVHNGIEYAMMQLISESYDFMKRGLGMNENEIKEIYYKWNTGELNGYLMEITGHIFSKVDETTGKRLINEILDVARQKGTGMWTSQSAMELQVPIPTIDVAVAIRNLSMLENQREKASKLLKRPQRYLKGDKNKLLYHLHQALYTSILISYVQGMAILSAASVKYKYNLDLEAVARIWRGGCIIRSAMLEDIRAAFRSRPDLPNILLDPIISHKIMEHEEGLRQIITSANDLGIPLMGMMVSLGYYDAYRSSWLPANLIQAQRDYFGAHTYERIDTKGTFHTEWDKK
jgi:6-phosphogluconate dehydrogenase